MIGADDPDMACPPGQEGMAAAAMWMYSNKLAEQKVEHPDDTLVSLYVNGEVEGEKISPVELNHFFVLLSGTNQRQLVAIADAVRDALREEEGWRPTHVEGYPRQEWILLDYDRFVVHVFTPATRSFYDLERLWGEAGRLEVAE